MKPARFKQCLRHSIIEFKQSIEEADPHTCVKHLNNIHIILLRDINPTGVFTVRVFFCPFGASNEATFDGLMSNPKTEFLGSIYSPFEMVHMDPIFNIAIERYQETELRAGLDHLLNCGISVLKLYRALEERSIKSILEE